MSDQKISSIQSTGWRETIREDLSRLSDQKLRRELRLLAGAQGPVMRFRGRELLQFAGNNYLGLADHPALAQAAEEAARALGCTI